MARTPPGEDFAYASSEAEDAFDIEVEDDDADLEIEDDVEGDDSFIDSVLGGGDPQVDLSVDQQMAIDLAYNGIDEKSFYEVLLLPKSADQRAIKKAYYRLSKEYHPDKFYRKNLGGFKLKLEVIFNKITEAYRILSDPDARGDYDDLVFGVPEEQKETRASTVSEASTTVTFVPQAEKKREALQKARAAARKEARRKKSRPVFMQNFQKQLAQRIAKARAAMAKGQQAMEVEDWETAASLFQRAMTLDPRNPRAKTLYKRAVGHHRNAKAEGFYRQAQDVLVAEDTKRAAELLQQAVGCTLDATLNVDADDCERILAEAVGMVCAQ